MKIKMHAFEENNFLIGMCLSIGYYDEYEFKSFEIGVGWVTIEFRWEFVPFSK